MSFKLNVGKSCYCVILKRARILNNFCVPMKHSHQIRSSLWRLSENAHCIKKTMKNDNNTELWGEREIKKKDFFFSNIVYIESALKVLLIINHPNTFCTFVNLNLLFFQFIEYLMCKYWMLFKIEKKFFF